MSFFGAFARRRLKDALLPAAITLALAAFFGFGLLWPLGHSLTDAVRSPARLAKPRPGETLAAFARRHGLSEGRLHRLNGLAPGEAPGAAPRLIVQAPRWTTAHVSGLFAPAAPQWRWILNSLWLALIVTACCVALGYPLAYCQVRTSFPGRRLLGGLLMLPLVLPPFVGAIGLRRLLARYGSLNLLLIKCGWVSAADPIDFLGAHRLFGCALVMVLHFYPLLYLLLAAAIANVDPSLIEAAKSLGRAPGAVFRRVLVPLSMPGLVAGGSLVFVGAFTDLGTPLIFSYQEVAAKQIFSLANEQASNPAAPALVAVVTLIVLLLFGLTRWALSRHGGLSGGGGNGGGGGGGGLKGASRAEVKRLSGLGAAAVVGFHVAVVLLAVLPHAAVFLSGLADRWFMTIAPESWTLGHVQEALAHPVAQLGVRNSLLYAAGSTLLDLVLGLACAWVIVRRGGWWGRLLDGLTLAPLAIPGIVLAFGYVAVYANWYQGGAAFLPVGWFLVLSYAVRRLPYTTRACAAGLEQTPRELEEAGGGLGAPPGPVLAKVTVPLITAHVVAGGILAFAFAMLEVSDSLILANRPRDFPLTKAIYYLFGRVGDGDQLASALGLFAVGFMALSLLSAGAFLGRKWGEVFQG